MEVYFSMIQMFLDKMQDSLITEQLVIQKCSFVKRQKTHIYDPHRHELSHPFLATAE